MGSLCKERKPQHIVAVQPNSTGSTDMKEGFPSLTFGVMPYNPKRQRGNLSGDQRPRPRWQPELRPVPAPHIKRTGRTDACPPATTAAAATPLSGTGLHPASPSVGPSRN